MTNFVVVEKSLALLVFSVAFALGASEIGLRILGVRFDASLYGQDAVTGWRLRPNAQGWWVSEGHAYVRINSAGMHDREYSFEKPPGTVRIAALGDSMTSALQVDVESNFCRVLERELSRCEPFRGRRVEVMNFGVPGFGTAQELLQFRHQVVRYNPDAIILAFYTDNDVQNNHRALNPVDPGKGPYFVFNGATLVLDNSFRKDQSRYYGAVRDKFGDLANRSRVVQLAAEVLLRKGLFRKAKQREQEALQKKFGHDPSLQMFAPPANSEMREAWQVTEALILLLRKEAEQRGMKFWLVTLSQSPQHLPAGIRDERAAELGIQDLFYPDRRLEDFARRWGIPALILAPQMAEWATQHPEPLAFGPLAIGHYTETGHRVVGAAVAQALCEGW